MDIRTKYAKLFNESRKEAILQLNKCNYPNCEEKAINSHILQKNGILSEISPNRFLYEQVSDLYKNPSCYFKRIGINEAFSFNCFCKTHDTELFKEIEKNTIDFKNYNHLLLLTLRTTLNEKFKKQIVLKQNEIAKSKNPELAKIMLSAGWIEQEKLGFKDIEFIENMLWNDLLEGSKTFVFETRELSLKQICLSSYFTYDTTIEIEEYFRKYGVEKERLIDIFINLFPYKNKSFMIMAYEKEFDKVVKGYVNSFFKENEKRVERKLTNLLLFQCENWVCSESFYNQKIKNIANHLFDMGSFALKNINERQFFDLNIFKENFKEKMHIWHKKYVG